MQRYRELNRETQRYGRGSYREIQKDTERYKEKRVKTKRQRKRIETAQEKELKTFRANLIKGRKALYFIN